MKKGCTFTYNYLNLPEKITWSPAQYIEFIYDATGRKLRKIVTASSTKTVFDYCDGVEYKNGVFAAIYHAEGRVVKDPIVYASPYVYQYTLRDHLGNGRVYFTDKTKDNIIDDSDILQDQTYYAFGGEIDYSNYTTTIDINKYQYNGKELNDEFNLNLSDYGARWYDGAIGRWTSVDPLTENQESFSPYHYTYDNPIRYNDPDGRMPDGCCESLHTALDIAGLVPGLGEIADGLNAVVYAIEGDFKNSGMSAAAMIPIAGNAVTAGKFANKAVDAAKAIEKVAETTKTATKVAENAQQGKAFEKVVTGSLDQKGHKNIAEQITIKAENGVKTRVDIVSKDAKGKINLTEAKSSQTAPLTKNQKIAFPSIEKQGGTIVGKGKPGYEGGTKIAPTKIDIVRPKK